jgi:dihydroorotase
MNSLLMRRALEYGRTFGLAICQHAEDTCLSKGGVMNEGIHSTRAGMRGIPSAAETTMVERDIRLVELTGARYHVAHISTSAAVEAVRQAKARGLPVTCEVTPHHLFLTDHRCLTYDTSTKMNPPLRTDEDVAAMRTGLADGTIDAVATDHAPHSSIEKDIEFEDAAFGIVGLETALPLVLQLVQEGLLTEIQAIDRLSTGPARVYQLPGGSLDPGSIADVTLIDPQIRWQVDPEAFESKGRNTPFAGWDMTGRAVFTIVDGRVVHELERTIS